LARPDYFLFLCQHHAAPIIILYSVFNRSLVASGGLNFLYLFFNAAYTKRERRATVSFAPLINSIQEFPFKMGGGTKLESCAAFDGKEDGFIFICDSF
jgi:hypothetical protein